VNKNNSLLFSVTTFLLLSLLVSLHFLPFKGIVNYSIVWIGSSFLFILFSYLLIRQNLSSCALVGLLLIGFLVRLSFISSSPIGSDDIYRYMWDGKLQGAGINPYRYKPLDEKLNLLHSDILPSKMNFREMRTIYFPLSQWLFLTGYKLGGENYWGYKSLLLLFELMTVASLYLLLGKFKLDKKNLLLYAFCPLPIIQFAVDAHLDGFGLPFLLLALYFYMDEKKILSAIMLGLSFSIKPVGIVMIPIFFLLEEKMANRVKFLIIPFIAFGIQFLPYIFSSNPFEAFLIYTKNWFYNGMIFNLLNSFYHNNQTSRMVCSGLLTLSLIPIYFSKKIWIDKIYLALIMLMIFSPVVHPWYIAWVAIFIPFTKRWSAIYFVAAASLTSFTLLNYLLNGIWKDYWVVQFIEYTGLLVILLCELFFMKNKTSSSQQILN
jgi:alpha-1,6-mannosyltransferase